MRNTVSLVLCATLVAGCGFVKVRGLPSFGGSKAEQPAAPPAGAAGGQSAPSAGVQQDLEKAYQAVSWRYFLPGTYASTVGPLASINFDARDTWGRLKYAACPDTAWLPGWDPDAEEAFGREAPAQVAQAGINRTWQKQCFDDYAAFRAGWSAIEKTYRPKLEAAMQNQEPYARIVALQDLLDEVSADAKQQGLVLDKAHPDQWVGLRWEIVKYLVDAVQGARVEFALHDILGDDVWNGLGPYQTYGRSWTTDDAFERDVFCWAAEKHGTQRTPSVPTPNSGVDMSIVQEPVSAARQQEILPKLNQLSDWRPAFASWAIPTPFSGDPDPKAPTITRLSADSNGNPLIVQSVKTQGGQQVIDAASKTSQAFGYDCRSTDRIDRVLDSGQVIYQQDCKTGTEEDVTSVHVTFMDLPVSLTVAKGDAIEIYGVLRNRKNRNQDHGQMRLDQVDFTVEGRYLIVRPHK